MAENKSIWGKRVLAGLGALALTSAGLLGGSTAAFADSELGNIDFTKTGDLTVHKYQHQNGAEEKAPDGSGGSFANPIGGVVFTAYPITSIDLKKNDDWARLGTLTPGTTCDQLGAETLGTGIELDPTDATTGAATLTGLSIGAYLVCETDAPETVADRALPFIVSIPMPYNDGWLYNVHVYPKNGITSIEKDVSEPSGLGLGSTVQFPVTTQVPRVATGTTLNNYIVTDVLDPRLNPVSVVSVTIDGVDVSDTYYDKLAPTAVAGGNKLGIAFNAAGLAWLSETGQHDKSIVTTFQGTVAEVGTGVIKNTANVYIHDPESGVESNEVETKWGDVKVLKVDSAEPSKVLDGAVFEVYAAKTTYPEAGVDCAAEIADGATPISVNGATTFTSANGGVVSIAGLFVSDSNIGAASDEACYVLKEIEAPAGYVLPTDPYTAVAVKTGETVVADGYDGAPIENTQQTVPELPLTGANGQMVMIIGGSALLLIAGGVVMLNRRRTSETKNNQ